MKTKQTKKDLSGAMVLPGAMAIAATTAGAQAATVQITLIGNKISSSGGNQLVADLTGDGADDITVGYVGASPYLVRVELDFLGAFGEVATVAAWAVGDTYYADAQFVGLGAGAQIGTHNVTDLNPFTFTDARINGGAATNGWLEVNAFNTSYNNHTVQLTRLLFDDASTTRPEFASAPGALTEWQVSAVPEPSSSLALLALGAGGLLTRRRIKSAA